jgi:hypothetical protein
LAVGLPLVLGGLAGERARERRTRDEAGSGSYSSIGHVKRGLAWLAGALGLAAVWRLKRRAAGAFERPEIDPADELRARLEQARDAPDDRDAFDAAEGQPVNEVGEGRSLEERRKAIHDKAQQALGEMRHLDGE